MQNFVWIPGAGITEGTADDYKDRCYEELTKILSGLCEVVINTRLTLARIDHKLASEA